MATKSWAELMGSAEEPEDFTPLPAGPYTVRVESCEVRPTKTQKTMFAVTYVVTEGPYAGRKIWQNLVVSPESPKAMGFFFADMAKLGASKEFFATEPAPEAVAAQIAGTTVQVTIGPQRNDPTRQEVKRIASLDGAAPAAAPQFAAAQPVAPAPAAPAPAPRQAPARPF